MIQLVIVTVLLFVMFFGIGFILNMLLKTTWFPIYLFLALLIGSVVYGRFDSTVVTANLGEFTVVDYIPVVGGLFGSIVCGFANRFLRVNGYKMY